MNLTDTLIEKLPYLENSFLMFGLGLNVDNPDFDTADFKVIYCINGFFENKDKSDTLSVLFDITRALRTKYGVNTYIDFLYTPPEKDYKLMNGQVFGYCSGRTLSEFDVVGISISVIEECPYIHRLMTSVDFPSNHADRNDTDPIVMLGGVMASATDLVSPYLDLVYIGDGEKRLPEVLYDLYKSKGQKRLYRIEQICRKYNNIQFPMGWSFLHKGLQIVDIQPKYDWVHEAQMFRCYDDDITLYSKKLLTDYDDGVNRGNILVGKGCTAPGCSFCKEGFEYGKWHEFSVESIEKAFKELRQVKPISTISLYAFNTNFHTHFPLLYEKAYDTFAKSSQIAFRGDVLAEDLKMLDLLKLCGVNKLSIGLEGVSHRIRNTFLNKALTWEHIFKIIEYAISSGITLFKFNMIYTGYETPEDFAEFKQVLLKIKQRLLTHGVQKFRITLSWTTLVHYNTTPLRYFDRKSIRAELEEARPILDFKRDMQECMGNYFDSKAHTGFNLIWTQLSNDYGRLLHGYLPKFFENKYKIDYKTVVQEILNDN